MSGKNLDQFFKQWVFEGEGIPELQYEWSSRKKINEFEIDLLIYQLQNGYDIYKFPVDIKIIYEDESQSAETRFVNQKNAFLKLTLPKKPKRIILDPDGWLLADIRESN
jgi:aminopeptidase N